MKLFLCWINNSQNNVHCTFQRNITYWWHIAKIFNRTWIFVAQSANFELSAKFDDLHDRKGKPRMNSADFQVNTIQLHFRDCIFTLKLKFMHVLLYFSERVNTFFDIVTNIKFYGRCGKIESILFIVCIEYHSL